jgi:hypothetical protein
MSSLVMLKLILIMLAILACSYCSPQFSSTWQQEVEQTWRLSY